jgi:cytoskeletal protein CcmA (bactofilin family)
MFNRDALFGKKDETPRSEPRSVNVNVTPSLGGGAPPMRPQPVEPAKPDLRFAETPRAPARVEEPAGSKLIVGPDIKLRGVEITDCDTLVVEGRVEASMDSRVVQIAESGVFAGTVSIDVAEIRGRFEGQLTARKQLVIYSTGRVSGRICYGKIRIEEGGEISGEISTLAAATPAAVTTAAAAAATAPAATTAAPAPAAPPPVAPSVTPQARPAQSAAAAAVREPDASTLHLPPVAPRPGNNKPSRNAGVNTV